MCIRDRLRTESFQLTVCFSSSRYHHNILTVSIASLYICVFNKSTLYRCYKHWRRSLLGRPSKGAVPARPLFASNGHQPQCLPCHILLLRKISYKCCTGQWPRWAVALPPNFWRFLHIRLFHIGQETICIPLKIGLPELNISQYGMVA